MASSGITESYDGLIPSFFRNLHTRDSTYWRTPYGVLHSGSINLHSHQQCKRVPFFFTSSPAFIVHRFFDDSDHSDLCEVISYCSFDLHFSNNE